jgi:hypothetical protein
MNEALGAGLLDPGEDRREVLVLDWQLLRKQGYFPFVEELSYRGATFLGVADVGLSQFAEFLLLGIRSYAALSLGASDVVDPGFRVPFAKNCVCSRFAATPGDGKFELVVVVTGSMVGG